MHVLYIKKAQVVKITSLSLEFDISITDACIFYRRYVLYMAVAVKALNMFSFHYYYDFCEA